MSGCLYIELYGGILTMVAMAHLPFGIVNG